MSRHSPTAHCPCCHNTIFVLRYNSSQPAFPSCNIITILQLKFSCSPFHFKSQYTPNLTIQSQPLKGHVTIQSLSHNTIWAVANFQFLHHFFFVFFHYKYIPAAGKITKKKISFYPFFFHFLEHSNKFIKIYCTPFSSILLLVKSQKIMFSFS